MSEYKPDAWVIVRFSSKDTQTIDKVMGGWYGGYAGSDEWKLSSGITDIVAFDDRYEIHNYSGSVYVCYKGTERMSGLMSSILSGWIEQAAQVPESQIKIEIVDIVELLK